MRWKRNPHAMLVALLAGAVWVLSFGFMAVLLGSLADRFSRTRVIAAALFHALAARGQRVAAAPQVVAAH